MDAKLMEMRRNGMVFRLEDLPADHPAIAFAKSVNPDFRRN